MNKKTSILLFLVGTLSSGCLTDTIQPDVVVDYTEKLVVNTVFTDQSPMRISVSNSSAAFNSSLPQAISDATVTVFQNSIEHDLVYNSFDDTYDNATVLDAGDAVTLEVKHPSYGTVNAVFRMPSALGAIGTLTPDGGLDTSGLSSDLLSVQFQDDPTRKNFYQINFYYYNETINQFIPMAFSQEDPALSEFNSVSLNDGSVLFTDELFSGKSKTLSTVAPYGLVLGNTGVKYMIEISSITEDFFKYYTTLQRARDAKEITFTGGYNNAVVIHSNINLGLGIAGGASTQQITLQ